MTEIFLKMTKKLIFIKLWPWGCLDGNFDFFGPFSKAQMVKAFKDCQIDQIRIKKFIFGKYDY